MQRGVTPPFVDATRYDSILEATPLPDANQLRANLMLYIADQSTTPGTMIDLTYEQQLTAIGALTRETFYWVVQSLDQDGYLEVLGYMGGAHVTITYRGWGFVDELRKGVHASRKAFMAMKFGDAACDAMFASCFKVASKACGYDLIRLDEAPTAGLIDNRLRVEILTARFVIVDLTHGNQGAYWEAGFAEGVGKPVIYTCEKSVFDSSGTHFDTNHYHTVSWDSAHAADVLARLKATIRATLPAEAVLED